MEKLEKTKFDLGKKYRKVFKTPAGFAFFVAIHDFIKYIELNSALSDTVSTNTKINRSMGLLAKYGYLKQIYQGIEDIRTQSNVDLGHERYMIICDLNRIQDERALETNSFWRKRESFRRSTTEVYERLRVHLSESENK